MSPASLCSTRRSFSGSNRILPFRSSIKRIPIGTTSLPWFANVAKALAIWIGAIPMIPRPRGYFLGNVLAICAGSFMPKSLAARFIAASKPTISRTSMDGTFIELERASRTVAVPCHSPRKLSGVYGEPSSFINAIGLSRSMVAGVMIPLEIAAE